MTDPRRDVAFVLASTDHGMMIVNRYDQCIVDPAKGGFGVGYELLNRAQYEPREVAIAMELLTLRHKHHGDGVKVVDCGANIGTHTVSWARHMNGWGDVIAIEPQERLFYALCGNITLNNCFNARAIHAAVASKAGKMRIPTPDYREYGSFGSLQLQFPDDGVEFIGQTVDYRPESKVSVETASIDSMGLQRLDFLKIDVEGMEMDVLAGARETLIRYHPIIDVEALKVDKNELKEALLGLGYVLFPFCKDILAVHSNDPTLKDVQERQNACGV